ncbi:MAG: prepilin-type N-terminal cleavage/methylation domain-containing protein [Candidatus Curtissbacteria bacterium]|nr:prepilin-type N-terminal cleavage/methylation domain-containing protein [Candidatus Curtissbacteria bacterium]MDZ4209612.1 prepilin-type N-terminal cleavage/methylation domain-containing protein [Candidatus Curtissbacteria bacterium]
MKKLSKGFTLIRTKLHLNLVDVKGFTLIELLIVIAVIGVLAAAVWTALDPNDKINAANDAKIQSDVGSLGQAEEAYATTKSGFYTDDVAAQTALVSNGDLKQALVPPAGYGSYAFKAPDPACAADAGAGCTKVVVCAPARSKKYNTVANTGVWIYSSSSGKACNIAVAAEPDATARCAGATADSVCP